MNLRGYLALLLGVAGLNGCAVISVAGAAVSVAATAVSVTADVAVVAGKGAVKAGGWAVDAMSSDDKPVKPVIVEAPGEPAPAQD
ncbi:hypothetical protein FNU76_01040 [Chitinimonas arctica]|uniref:Lipoprotein n=2 Tax=Chitinimonas arctica TaxID=2594795 RepID=A0A516SLZ6_9NEIS|nr:hypothetical protein FNU76_01040 [Chitinimonas arctica]